MIVLFIVAMAFASWARSERLLPIGGTAHRLFLATVYAACVSFIVPHTWAGVAIMFGAWLGCFLAFVLVGHGLRYTMGRELPKPDMVARGNEPLLWWLPVVRLEDSYYGAVDCRAGDLTIGDTSVKCVVRRSKWGQELEVAYCPIGDTTKLWIHDAAGMLVIGFVRGAFMFWPLAFLDPWFFTAAWLAALANVVTAEIGWQFSDRGLTTNPIRAYWILWGAVMGALL